MKPIYIEEDPKPIIKQEPNNNNNEYAKQSLVDAILEISKSFDMNIYTREQLENKTYEQLDAIKESIMKKIHTDISENFEMVFLTNAVQLVEMLSSKININLSYPYSLSQSVSNNEKIKRITKTISILSNFQKRFQSPYAQLGIITLFQALDILQANKIDQHKNRQIVHESIQNPQMDGQRIGASSLSSALPSAPSSAPSDVKKPEGFAYHS